MLWVVIVPILVWPLLKNFESMGAYRDATERYLALTRGVFSEESAEHHPMYQRPLERADRASKSRNKAFKIALPIVAVLIVIQSIFRI